MSDYLNDILKKAKENADTLDEPKEAAKKRAFQPGREKTSAGVATEPDVPRKDSMSIKCPSCEKDSVVAVNRFRRVGTGIGGTLGAIVGPTTGRAAIKVLVSAAGGPAGAILGAILCAIVGGWAGRTLGKMIDEDMVCQYKCLQCDHRFYI